MEWSLGQAVISKQGRDNRTCYVITGMEDRYCFVADGRKTTCSSPKRKNLKHLQGTNHVSADFKSRLEQGNSLRDEEIREYLNFIFKKAKKEVPNG